MIRNNLAILMSERGIKNGELSLRTGISKNTISATAKGDGKMIQLETIDKICQALGVTPNEFFSYTPYNVSFKILLNKCDFIFETDDTYTVNGITFEDINIDLLLTIEKSNRKINDYFFTIKKQGVTPFAIEMLITSNDDNNLNEFNDEFEKIPSIFRFDVLDEIKKEIEEKIIEFVREKSAINELLSFPFDYDSFLKQLIKITFIGVSTF